MLALTVLLSLREERALASLDSDAVP